MSDTNSPGSPGEAREPGGGSWPEYLSGGPGGPEPAARPLQHEGDDPEASESEYQAGPHRVIGTPSPATTRTMLPRTGEDGGKPVVRELPAEPDDPQRAKKAERLVATFFILAALAGVGFLVCYAVFDIHSLATVQHSNLALGGCLSLVFLLMAVGAVIWVRHVMPTVELTEQRHPLRSTPEARAAFKETFTEGAEASQFVKRPLIRRTLIAASVPLAVAPLFLLRDLGPLPGTSLDFTVWRKGLRLLVYGTGAPITAAEFDTPGQLISVGPEGYLDNDDAMAKAAVSLIKFRPGELVFGPATKPGAPSKPNLTVPNWTVDNIVAYSKICTHLGCPAALYEQTTHYILCPCHQSTFLSTEGARVIFGPATRALPQLPIGVDSDGYLIALSDFNEPVGPSFWERS
jgi:ubiquinol-cytochrome c reductase iron-sulfur subunit